jgi:hypothetical protein
MNLDRLAAAFTLNLKERISALAPPTHPSPPPKPKVDQALLKLLECQTDRKGTRLIYRQSSEGRLYTVIKRKQAGPMTNRALASTRLPSPLPAPVPRSSVYKASQADMNGVVMPIRLRKSASLSEEQLLPPITVLFSKVSPIDAKTTLTSNKAKVKQITEQIAKLRRESSLRIQSLRQSPTTRQNPIGSFGRRSLEKQASLRSSRAFSEKRL